MNSENKPQKKRYIYLIILFLCLVVGLLSVFWFDRDDRSEVEDQADTKQSSAIHERTSPGKIKENDNSKKRTRSENEQPTNKNKEHERETKIDDKTGLVRVFVRTPDGTPVENANLKVDFVETTKDKTLDRSMNQNILSHSSHTDDAGRGIVRVRLSRSVQNRINQGWRLRIRARKEGYYFLKTKKNPRKHIRSPDPKLTVRPRSGQEVKKTLTLRKGRKLKVKLRNYQKLSDHEKTYIRTHMEFVLQLPQGQKLGSYKGEEWHLELSHITDNGYLHHRYTDDPNINIPRKPLLFKCRIPNFSRDSQKMFLNEKKVIPGDPSGKPVSLTVLRRNPDFVGRDKLIVDVSNPMGESEESCSIVMFLYDYGKGDFHYGNAEITTKKKKFNHKYDMVDPDQYGLYVEALSRKKNQGWWYANRRFRLKEGETKKLSVNWKKATLVKIKFMDQKKNRYLSMREAAHKEIKIHKLFPFDTNNPVKEQPKLFEDLNNSKQKHRFVLLNSFVSNLYIENQENQFDKGINEKWIRKPSFNPGQITEFTINVNW